MPLELGTPIRALPAVGTPRPCPQPQPRVLGPTGLSGEEPTGKVDLGLSLSCGPALEVLVPVGQSGCEETPPGACPLPSPPGPMGSRGASPRRDQAADPAPHSSSMAQELLTSAGAARQPVGIPRGRKITPKSLRLVGLWRQRLLLQPTSGDPSPTLHPTCAVCSETGSGFCGHNPEGSASAPPPGAAFQEKAVPRMHKMWEPENACEKLLHLITSPRLSSPAAGAAPCRAHRGFTSTPGRLGHS